MFEGGQDRSKMSSLEGACFGQGGARTAPHPRAADAEQPRASVIIPAFNEETAISGTLNGLLAHPALVNLEIIVVDDGSSDSTAAKVLEFTSRVKLVRHSVNRGYGAAISTGIMASKGKYVVWYDADGQHRPDDLAAIIERLIADNLDFCVGIRGRDSHRVRSRVVGKFVLRTAVRIATRRDVGDFNSGLRGYRREVIEKYLHLLPIGFGASTTMTLLTAEGRYRGADVPIIVKERIGKSSVRQVRDGFRTLMLILQIFLIFNPLKFFGSIGLVLFGFGSAYGIWKILQEPDKGVSVLSVLVIMLGAQSLFLGLICDQISAIRRERLR